MLLFERLALHDLHVCSCDSALQSRFATWGIIGRNRGRAVIHQNGAKTITALLQLSQHPTRTLSSLYEAKLHRVSLLLLGPKPKRSTLGPRCPRSMERSSIESHCSQRGLRPRSRERSSIESHSYFWVPSPKDRRWAPPTHAHDHSPLVRGRRAGDEATREL